MPFESGCIPSATITSSGTSVVAGPGHYYGMVMVSGTSVVVTTIKVYDGISASGALVDAVTISGTSLTGTSDYAKYKAFANGLYVVVNNTAQVTGNLWYAVR